MKRFNLVQVSLWVALVLALVGSLRHVAWAFGTLEDGDIVAGYIQAVAVDIGLFALAYAIHQRRRERRPTRVLWVGVLLFSAVSTYANLLHGLYFAADIGLDTWASVRPFVLSAVLPAIVIYLSEILSDNQNFAERERQKAVKAEQRKVSSTEGLDTFPYPIEQARQTWTEQREHTKSEILDSLVDILGQQPDAKVSELARRVNKSRTTVYGYLAELERQGKIHRNGKLTMEV